MNATLGFGAIYVVTEDTTTWRVQGLVKAADLVGLQLTIHPLQHREDGEVLEHLGDKVLEKPSTLNAVRLTMNYIALFEIFALTDLETVLFVEDDVDFGVDIKAQMDVLSASMSDKPTEGMSLVGSNSLAPNDTASNVFRPYGLGSWDILWLGFYGVEFTGRSEIQTYRDPYALPWKHLTSTYNSYYKSIRTTTADSQSEQQIIRDVTAIASYAWAFTRSHAQRLAKELRTEHAEYIDVAVHLGCKALRQRCVAPVPELFHHHRVPGQKRLDNAGNQSDGQHDLSWWQGRHKYTYNVEWSARCNAMGVGERIGDRWQCLPGKYDDLA